MNITDPLADFVPNVGVLNGPYCSPNPLAFTRS